MDTKTTRLPVDLLDAAEAEGAEEHRSAAKQIEHWARFGMYFAGQSTAQRRRIQRAVAGEIPLATLTADERVVANAAINAEISTGINSINIAERMAARGVATVVMDEEGRMVRRDPDGTTTTL